MKVRVASSPCWVLYSARIGTNAWENAPSAKMRRSRLGSLKAMKKASVATPAPNTRARMVSRTKPSTREIMVMELTAARDLRRFIESFSRLRIKGCAATRPVVRYSAPQRKQSKSSRVYRSYRRRESLPCKEQPLSGSMQVPLTTDQLIGMIRGLFCLLFTKSFEELDGGQLTFRQKTCKTG
ncbi:hypothetical protein D3C79_744400 [compost metagenome]